MHLLKGQGFQCIIYCYDTVK